jgi:deoxyribodipyrimidine photo-lyase
MHKGFEGMREPFFNEDFFKAWTLGQTGYPLVDACMRSLWENGWITFRMRAMLVAFASYDLWLDWRQTAPFLGRLFTDYEPGIHYSQFQMQSGVTGINAFRLYNPIKQSQTHDPEGKFIKRFVPELCDVPSPFIHEPWKMSCPPKGYPSPIVDHTQAIQKAKMEIGLRLKGEGFKAESQKVYAQLGSRKRSSVPKKPPQKEKFKQLSFDF